MNILIKLLIVQKSRRSFSKLFGIAIKWIKWYEDKYISISNKKKINWNKEKVFIISINSLILVILIYKITEMLNITIFNNVNDTYWWIWSFYDKYWRVWSF